MAQIPGGVTIPAVFDVRLLHPGEQNEKAGDEIWQVLVECDKDFVPPLSSRSGTTAKTLSTEGLWGGPTSYFDEVMQQYNLLAHYKGELAGLLSLIPHHEDTDLLADWSPSTYISTIAILPPYRRHGLGKALYESVFALSPDLASPYVTLRSWSTNVGNLDLLAELDFTEVVRLPDHRGPGVDTIYFARPSGSAHQ